MGQKQREEALALANVIRFERARYRHSVKDLPYEEGRQKLAEILDENPECIATIRVEELIGWVRKMHEGISQDLLLQAQCSAFTLVNGLGERRRGLLAAGLRRELARYAA